MVVSLLLFFIPSHRPVYFSNSLVLMRTASHRVPISLGLSPSIHSIDQIKVVDRFRGPYYSPLLLLSSRLIRLCVFPIRNTT